MLDFGRGKVRFEQSAVSMHGTSESLHGTVVVLIASP